MWGGVVVTFIVIIIVVIAVSIRFGGNGSDEEKKFTPGDTRFQYVSTFFCNQIRASSHDGLMTAQGNVYLLDHIPSIDSHSLVTIPNDKFTLYSGDYKYWNFYLHPQSTFSLDACISDDSPGGSYTFYIIKGTGNFNSWLDDPRSSVSLSYKYISRLCSQGMTHMTFTVKDEDHYYLVYYNDDYIPVSGTQNVTLDRMTYSIPSNSIQNCSFDELNSCEVNIDFVSPIDKILIIISTPPNVDWDTDTYAIDIDCNPQPYGYVIITVGPFLLLVFCLVAVISLCVLYRRVYKRSTIIKDSLIPIRSESPPPPYNESYK
jgi:hypothetical protein